MSDILAVEPTEKDAVEHVVRHLRERDRREIFALRWDDDEDALTNDLFSVAGPMWRIWSYRGEPVAMAGIIPQRPGVVNAGAFGTEKFSQVMRPIMRWARGWVIPRLMNAGVHRIEAYASAANVDGHRFIEVMGAKREAYLRQYGRDREDFVLYVRRL